MRSSKVSARSPVHPATSAPEGLDTTPRNDGPGGSGLPARPNPGPSNFQSFPAVDIATAAEMLEDAGIPMSVPGLYDLCCKGQIDWFPYAHGMFIPLDALRELGCNAGNARS